MWFRRPSSLCLALLLWWIGATPGLAVADTFTVRGIAVDRTAETAAAAREAAIAEGHIEALRALYRKLVVVEDLERAPTLSADRVVEYVRDFAVANERTSAVRYLAELTFRFKPAAIRDLLREHGLRFAETESKPLLVLPLFGSAEDAVLWEEPNPWRQVWSRRPADNGLVPLLTPLGDLADLTGVSADQAQAGEPEPLLAMAERYGADDVLVTRAMLSGDPKAGQAALEVASSRFGSLEQQATWIGSYSQQADEDLEAMLRRAAADVAARVQADWKAKNLLSYGSESTIAVTVPLGGFGEWLEVRRRLQRVAALTGSALTALSRDRAQLELTFLGDTRQLALALAQSDLRLGDDAAAGWWLGLAESAVPPQMPVAAPTLGDTLERAGQAGPPAAPTSEPFSEGPVVIE